MIWTLALRNLLFDRIRLTVALAGIAFAVLLAGTQLGLYLGASKLITNMIEHTGGDLWVMHKGTESFEEGLPILGQRERSLVAGAPGVEEVQVLVVNFADWTHPTVGLVHVLVVGADYGQGAFKPWPLASGTREELSRPQAVAVDRSYLEDLGITEVGQTAKIEGSIVRVAALTDGLRSFTQTPYTLMPMARARELLGLDGDAITFLVLRLKPGTDAASLADSITKRLDEVEVITTSDFVDRSLRRWLMGTGAGMALIGGTILGAIIGIVIVAQILYASTKDHIREYATLRSIGSTSGYLSKVVLAQAGFACLMGFAIGMSCVYGLIELSQTSPLPMALSSTLVLILLGLTVMIGALSSVAAIMQIRRVDPASLFAR